MDKLLSMWNLPSSLNDLDPWSINELGNFTGLFVWQPAISLIFESFLCLKTNFLIARDITDFWEFSIFKN